MNVVTLFKNNQTIIYINRSFEFNRSKDGHWTTFPFPTYLIELLY